MSTAKKESMLGLIVLIAILCGLSYWTFKELSGNYATVENSNRMVESVLENQTSVVRSYAAQISDFKKNMQQAEEVLAKVQLENAELKSKLAMLDNVAELERKVIQLEQANDQIKQEMAAAATASQQREAELHAKLQELLAEQNFQSVSEGRAVLAKYKQRLHQIKSRIRNFQVKELKEHDDAMLQAGNNGFLVRNGAPNKKVNIDVTFVK